MLRCPQHDSVRQFPHQRLSVGTPLTGNHQIGALHLFIKPYGIEQQVDTRPTPGTQILHERITQTAGSTGRKAGKGRVSFASGSAFKACCVREIRQILRVPAYAVNLLPTSFMPVLMVGVMAPPE